MKYPRFSRKSIVLSLAAALILVVIHYLSLLQETSVKGAFVSNSSNNEIVYGMIHNASFYKGMEWKRLPGCYDVMDYRKCQPKDRNIENYLLDRLRNESTPHLSVKNRPNCLAYWKAQSMNDSFFKVIDKNPNLTAYTAYLDDRLTGKLIVRVFLYFVYTDRTEFNCHFTDPETGLSRLSVPGKLHRLHEHIRPLPWWAHMLSCDISEHIELGNSACHVFITRSEGTLNEIDLIERGALRMPLRSTKKLPNELIQPKILCYRNLYGSKNFNVNFLAESIIASFGLGSAMQVFLIGEKPNPAMNSLFYSFEVTNPLFNVKGEKLRFRLIPYFLPVDQYVVFQFVQTILNNDLMLRVYPEYKYMESRDFDEIIVPNQGRHSLLESVEEYFRDNPREYLMCFTETRFLTEQLINSGLPGQYPLLQIKESVKHQTKLDDARSKCILRPEGIFEMHVHEALGMLYYFSEMHPVVDPMRYGQMLHYRAGETDSNNSPQIFEPLANSWLHVNHTEIVLGRYFLVSLLCNLN